MKELLQHEYRESDHWFFRARRRIFERLLDGLPELSAGARILELGPGSGVNMPVLLPRGDVTVVDVAELSLADCGRSGARNLVRADAGRPPFGDGSFDLICALDVLEHLKGDAAALRECRRVLAPRGYLFLTVPALRVLWGRQDVLSEHERRYGRAQLERLLLDAGFHIERLTYFNSVLFLPILGVRLLMRPFLRWTSKGGSDFSTPTPFGLDEVLCRAFASERAWLCRRDLPIGVSLLAVARPAP